MFKTVLVPVDLSQPERVGPSIEAARAVAGASGKLLLLHVVPPLPGYVAAELSPDHQKKVVSEAQSQLMDIAKKHGVASDSVLLHQGHVYREILDTAKDKGADLIVVASHQPEMADYLLGSVAARVVRHARCSVLVLR